MGITSPTAAFAYGAIGWDAVNIAFEGPKRQIVQFVYLRFGTTECPVVFHGAIDDNPG